MGKTKEDLQKPVAPKLTEIFYHGGSGGEVYAKGCPVFFTRDRKGAEWYATERGGNTPTIHEHKLDIKNPSREEDLIKVAKEIGVEIKETPFFDAPEISEHSPYYGNNPTDLLYIPRVVRVLQKKGFDGFVGWDFLENTEIEVAVPFSTQRILTI